MPNRHIIEHILWTVTITLLSLYYLRLDMDCPFLHKRCQGPEDIAGFLTLFWHSIYLCSPIPITLKMISEHAMVLTCSNTLLFPSFINCLILSWWWLYLQRYVERERERESERERGNRFVSFKFPLTVLHALYQYIPTYSCVKNK